LHGRAGFKKTLAVEKMTDEELALHEDEPPAHLFCELNGRQCKSVRQYHRATLLVLAKKNSFFIPDYPHGIF
jgi:hypothetical protein